MTSCSQFSLLTIEYPTRFELVWSFRLSARKNSDVEAFKYSRSTISWTKFQLMVLSQYYEAATLFAMQKQILEIIMEFLLSIFQSGYGIF